MSSSSTSDRVTEFLLAALALLALVGTWGHNLSYMSLGFLGANQRFWADTLANPASRSITVDLFAFALPVTYWMFLEARRLGMRSIWWYIAGSFLIAISVAFPVFLIHRERVRRRLGDGSTGALSFDGKLGMAVLTLVTVGYVLLSFSG